jgi:hypothetical protein
MTAWMWCVEMGGLGGGQQRKRLFGNGWEMYVLTSSFVHSEQYVCPQGIWT